MRQGFYRRLIKIKHLHWHTVRVQIMPSFLCNNNCSYCSRHFVGKMNVKENEHQLSAKQWLQRIDRFPVKVDEITLSGGEPSIYYDITDLINGLVERSIIVLMFTNCNVPVRNLKPNKRLRIIASLHEGADGGRFIRGADYYQSIGIRVDVDLLDSKIFGLSFPGDRKSGGGTVNKGVVKYTYSRIDCLESKIFNYGPDGKLWTSPGQCYHEYVHGYVRKSILWDLKKDGG